MINVDVRPLHLHTIESLCADLVSGRPVGVGSDNVAFSLSGAAPRAILDWYRCNRGRWATAVRVTDADALVDAALKDPPVLPESAAHSASAGSRRLTLTRIEAHRFAGIHAYGPVDHSPQTFVHELIAPLTLLEGLNGSGKTSLLNTVIWCLTGQLLRPQRAPESGDSEFECRVDGSKSTESPTLHRLSPVTPLPDPAVYRPTREWIAADTWVELTFADESGSTLPPVRRTQSRTARGKLEETVQNLDGLSLDPIALRTGTVMPGLLPFIQIGSQSELGRAVAELTGLAALVDLAAHAGRAKRRIDGDFVKAKTRDIALTDEAYNRTRTDLIEQINSHPAIAPAIAAPAPSSDTTIEKVLKGLVEHFEQTKAMALRDAETVLGEGFDAEDADARSDLESNISPALAEVQQLGRLPSAARLAALGKLTPAENADTARRVGDIIREAELLAALAAEPSRAARVRLYARVAAWMQDHPNDAQSEDHCAVCGGDLIEAVDPVTGRPVFDHLHESRDQDPDLLAQTLQRWAAGTLGALARDLPTALRAEIGQDLPEHPSDLIRSALVDELFETPPFDGVLSELNKGVAESCDAAISDWPALSTVAVGVLPSAFGDRSDLQRALNRLGRALHFAEWRCDHDVAIAEFRATIIGFLPSAGREIGGASLTGRLLSLDAIVKGAAPINAALISCKRMQSDLAKRRAAEVRLLAFAKASEALTEVISLGTLAEQQVDQLRAHLHESAATWRKRIYASAFPSMQHDLIETGMTSEGRLELLVGARGVAAPAQHVANASALRASLVAFFLAFWEYVLKDRGGLKLLLLDDPQELLDEENRERLAIAFAGLLGVEAQLVVTTYDRKFAGHVASLIRKTTIDHRSIHPVTPTRPTLQTAPAIADIQRRRKSYEADVDDVANAREYASESRIFLETRLGDMFDDAAYPASSTMNFAPTLADHLNRLTGLVNTPPSDLFRSQPIRSLANDRSLADGAVTRTLLNKAHHQRKHEIRPSEVAASAEDLNRLCKLAEKSHEECRRWRRRDKEERTVTDTFALASIARPNISLLVHPDLAAFTRGAAVGETQEVAADVLGGIWFDEKALFYLRCDNLGFAAPRGAIVIVDAMPSAVADRRLVIACRNSEVFARRLLRSVDSSLVALTAETLDPRNSPQTLLLLESEIALHQVVGVIFDDRLAAPRARTEAVAVEGAQILERIETAHRVKEDSAVPLALSGQIVLGGPCIPLDNFAQHEDGLVALSLNDGSSIFKRVGAALPAPISHLRQFESIGGLGESEILAIGEPQSGLRCVADARSIVGVLYHG